MSNKYILLSILIIASVFLSGCIDDKTANTATPPDFIPKTNFSSGFTFMGIHDTKVNIAGSMQSGFEGVYRYGGEDIYVVALKNDDPEALLARYKADIRAQYPKDYNPFEEISINNHPATKVSDLSVSNGKEEKKYRIIWAKEGYVVEVGLSTNADAVNSLATATGY